MSDYLKEFVGQGYYIETLGCSKNQVDSENLAAILEEAGMIERGPDEAYVLVVNTCSFLEAAVEESVEAILECAEFKKDKAKYLVVHGCMTQRYKDKLLSELDEVDLFIGTNQSHRLLRKLAEGERLFLDEPQYRPLETFQKKREEVFAYLKIAEGCDNRCSYCMIPYIRGPFVSRRIDEILREAKHLAAGGVKELILIAQDTSRFGIDRGRLELAELLEALNEVEGLQWIRLQYLYADVIDEKLLRTMKRLDKVVPYFDMPLQHINQEILKRMNRHTTTQSTKEIIALIRSIMPEAVLRTTLITGFPGETKEAHQELMAFIEETRFDRLGVFRYSDEEGSPSSKLDQKITEEIKEERYNEIMSTQMRISEEKLAEKLHCEIDVLVDEKTEGGYFGRSLADAPEVDGVVFIKTQDENLLHQMIRIYVTATTEYDLEGVPVHEFAK